MQWGEVHKVEDWLEGAHESDKCPELILVHHVGFVVAPQLAVLSPLATWQSSVGMHSTTCAALSAGLWLQGVCMSL